MANTQVSPQMPKTTWKCSNCGYNLEKDIPPDTCPSCKEKCDFVDVTCYLPDCGDTGSDTRL